MPTKVRLGGEKRNRMSNIVAGITLGTLCFPDITGATIGAWFSVSFGYGLNYTTGGIPAGLTAFADAQTIDFNGFLECTVWDESPFDGTTLYTFRYVPSTDKLQIFQTLGGSTGTTTELANGSALPTALLVDSSVVAKAVWNRSTVIG